MDTGSAGLGLLGLGSKLLVGLLVGRSQILFLLVLSSLGLGFSLGLLLVGNSLRPLVVQLLSLLLDLVSSVG